MSNQLIDGRRLRVLTIVDVFTRESMSVEVGPRLKATQGVGSSRKLALGLAQKHPGHGTRARLKQHGTLQWKPGYRNTE